MDYENHSSEPRRWDLPRSPWDKLKSIKISLPSLIVGAVCGAVVLLVKTFYKMKH